MVESDYVITSYAKIVQEFGLDWEIKSQMRRIFFGNFDKLVTAGIHFLLHLNIIISFCIRILFSLFPSSLSRFHNHYDRENIKNIESDEMSKL